MYTVKALKNTLIIYLAAALFLTCLSGLILPASAVGAGELSVTVKQVFANAASSPTPNKVFDYTFIPKQAQNPMPAGSNADGYSFTITGTNDINIGPIAFTQAGVYTYELRHTTAPTDGFTYDQEVYTLGVFVKADLTVTLVIHKSGGEKTASIAYTHSFNLRPTDPSLMADPPVVKTVNGRPSSSSTFTFNLTAGSPSNPMPQGSVNGVKTVYITGTGRAEFGTWAYTAEGTYYYKVSEEKSGVKGYTYDTTVYTITDTVANVDGQLVLTRVVTNKSNKQVTSMSFINTYSSGGGGGGGGGTTSVNVPKNTGSSPSPTPSPAPGTTPSPMPSPTPTPAPGITNPGTPGAGQAPNPDNPSNPGNPGTAGATGNPGNPENHGNSGRHPGDGHKTGDDSQAALYIVLFCLAGITALICAAYLLTGKRRRRCSE